MVVIVVVVVAVVVVDVVVVKMLQNQDPGVDEVVGGLLVEVMVSLSIDFFTGWSGIDLLLPNIDEILMRLGETLTGVGMSLSTPLRWRPSTWFLRWRSCLNVDSSGSGPGLVQKKFIVASFDRQAINSLSSIVVNTNNS